MFSSNRFRVYSNPLIAAHEPFPGLLELPLRSRVIEEKLTGEGCRIWEGLIAPESVLCSVHSERYVQLIKKLSTHGVLRSTFGSLLSPHLQYYCRVSSGSYAAILSSVGSCLSAFSHIEDGQIDRAFVLARPPGHHASTERGEGFCLINNVAVVAKVAIKKGMKVAVVDFDRHHGNGTEEILSRYLKDSLFVSSFQEGCKYAVHAGVSPKNSLRVPLSSFSNDEEVCARYREDVIPKIEQFKPDLILISAGFDMCKGDPLTNLQVTYKGYRDITRMILDVANIHCKGRVLSVLEGGYDPVIFMDSVISHVKELAE
jgi:acetoin utilization deacetylase AcuC-like enzyme